MNRRNFLSLSVLTPFLANDLFAKNKDILLSTNEFVVLNDLRQRLRRIRSFVGFANFNIISFNDTLFYARNYLAIGKFTKDELSLVEKLFYENPTQYGFFGDITSANINNKISKKDIKKISYTGHYLFKGTPLSDYKRMTKDIGNSLILTSGVRNVVKQLSLYCDKIYYNHGNLTQASLNIAPPAYSYHTISDFDVGRKGWGYKNFTADFAKTSEFYQIKKLDYIDMRYSRNNKEGVRFEPWHVKVI